MTFTDAIRTCLRKYFTFSGRASRAEYWWFVLFLFLGSMIAGVLDGLFFGTTLVDTGPGEVEVTNNGPLAMLFSLATLIPALAAGWRRMHDTGRSGLYLFYPLIIVVGIVTFIGLTAGFAPLVSGDFGAMLAGGSAILIAIAMFVLFLSPLIVLWWLTRPSDGDNQYGPNPHEVSP